MTPGRRQPHQALWVALFLAIVGTGRISIAQDEDDPDGKASSGITYSREHFDQWLFADARGADAGREGLESILKAKLEYLDRVCELTDDQKKKILLAGRGDIARFFGRVEGARRRFDLVHDDLWKIKALLNDLAPLRTTLASGPFGEESVFAKALRTTLDEEQSAEYEMALRERSSARHRDLVAVLAGLESHEPGSSPNLNGEQRRRLADLLLAEAQPARNGKRPTLDAVLYGASTRPTLGAVLYAVSTLPEAQLRPIFDDKQWRILGRQIERVRGGVPIRRLQAPAKP